MIALLVIIAVLLIAWVLINMKMSRPDGELVKKIHPYRRMLPFLMTRANFSTVYFDDYIKADALLDYIHRARQKFEINVTHCLVKAAIVGLYDHPKMNRFVVGKRMYQRNHVAITFTMKRKKLDKASKVTAVKMHFDDRNQTMAEHCRRINDRVSRMRTDVKTYEDKELDLFLKLPRPLLSWGVAIVKWLDYHNLLPASFVKNDEFHTSLFIANLGSLGMRAGYHHLYEYSTCPLFMMVGQIEDRPVVVDGEIRPQKTLHLRYSFDERIEDGLTAKFGIEAVRNALENPDEAFGQLE